MVKFANKLSCGAFLRWTGRAVLRVIPFAAFQHVRQLLRGCTSEVVVIETIYVVLETDDLTVAAVVAEVLESHDAAPGDYTLHFLQGSAFAELFSRDLFVSIGPSAARDLQFFPPLSYASDEHGSSIIVGLGRFCMNAIV
jgi:hypothetical protein